jgi:hypothetical protein
MVEQKPAGWRFFSLFVILPVSLFLLGWDLPWERWLAAGIRITSGSAGFILRGIEGGLKPALPMGTPRGSPIKSRCAL